MTFRGQVLFLNIMNPSAATAHVTLTQMLASGENRTQSVAVAPSSRSTVDVNGFPGPGEDVSAHVTRDRDIVVERPMYFSYHGKWDGGHDVMGRH